MDHAKEMPYTKASVPVVGEGKVYPPVDLFIAAINSLWWKSDSSFACPKL